MITLRKDYGKLDVNAAYAKLLDKAYNQLLTTGDYLSEAEKELGKFTNLESYFAHMSDLIDINPNYVLLPLDEAPFEINANARTITVPADFVKCAGVQNDEMCEIVTFTVDRYFDYMDLDNTFIVVQWINAANEQGVHTITLKDLETYQGKIRFGWPLTSDVTKQAGDVIFSVRFLVREGADLENPEEATGNKVFKYVLNTLPAKITIKSSLNILEPDIIESNVANYFKAFVVNSMNPTIPIPEPIAFASPGLDLSQYAALDANSNTLKLSAQAAASDNGIISYKWFYNDKEITGNEEVIEKQVVDGEEVEVKKFIYTLGEEYLPIKWANESDKRRIGGEKYYKMNIEGQLPPYIPYNDPITNDENMPELFERFTTLTINDTSAVITGTYYVKAENQVAVSNISNVTNTTSSSCKILAPNDIIVTKDLNTRVFLKENVAQVLRLELQKDPTDPQYNYCWYRTTNKPTNVEDIVADKELVVKEEALTNKTNTTYSITNEPGWYCVTADSVLNRTPKHQVSQICKVTGAPTVPTMSEIILLERLEGEEDWVENVVDGKETASYPFNSKIEFKVQLPAGWQEDADELLTEGLQYNWYVQMPDSEDRRLLTEADVSLSSSPNHLVVSGLNTNVLKVRSIGSSEQAYAYYCEIINKFDGLDTVATLDITEPFIVKFSEQD